MDNVRTISVPMANKQDTQPSIVHIEDDVPSSVPVTTHINKYTLIKDNNARLVENMTELGKAKVSPSCMDTYILDPELSFISPQSSGQNIENHNLPQVANSGHENEE